MLSYGAGGLAANDVSNWLSAVQSADHNQIFLMSYGQVIVICSCLWGLGITVCTSYIKEGNMVFTSSVNSDRLKLFWKLEVTQHLTDTPEL